eukprot:scaffold73037_cov63-Phaeocystis_antarctica.AAC.3
MKARAPSRAASARTQGAPPRRKARARPLWSVLQLGSRVDRSTARASAMRSGAASMSQCGGHQSIRPPLPATTTPCGPTCTAKRGLWWLTRSTWGS